MKTIVIASGMPSGITVTEIIEGAKERLPDILEHEDSTSLILLVKKLQLSLGIDQRGVFSILDLSESKYRRITTKHTK